jgi:hypothetical protein
VAKTSNNSGFMDKWKFPTFYSGQIDENESGSFIFLQIIRFHVSRVHVRVNVVIPWRPS